MSKTVGAMSTAFIPDCLHKRGSIEKKPASSHVVFFVKAFIGMPLCDRKMVGSSSVSVEVTSSRESHASRVLSSRVILT